MILASQRPAFAESISRALSPSANLAGPLGTIIAAMGVAARNDEAAIARLRLRLGLMAGRDVFPALLTFIEVQFLRKRWRVADRSRLSCAETMSAFAKQILLEYLNPACEACIGRRYLYAQTGAVTLCQRCGGIGHETGSRKVWAKALAMNESTYRETWQPRRDFILMSLADSDRWTLRYVRQKAGR